MSAAEKCPGIIILCLVSTWYYIYIFIIKIWFPLIRSSLRGIRESWIVVEARSGTNRVSQCALSPQYFASPSNVVLIWRRHYHAFPKNWLGLPSQGCSKLRQNAVRSSPPHACQLPSCYTLNRKKNSVASPAALQRSVPCAPWNDASEITDETQINGCLWNPICYDANFYRSFPVIKNTSLNNNDVNKYRCILGKSENFDDDEDE